MREVQSSKGRSIRRPDSKNRQQKQQNESQGDIEIAQVGHKRHEEIEETILSRPVDQEKKADVELLDISHHGMVPDGSPLPNCISWSL